MIQALIEGAIKRRKVILAVTLILSLFGLITYLTMPRESNPQIDVPFVAVVVPYPGVSPEDAERLLVRPLERALRDVPGIKEMNATAAQGVAVVNLEFEVNFDKQRAINDVRARLDQVRIASPHTERAAVDRHGQDPPRRVAAARSRACSTG